MRDVKVALRRLRHQPAFAALAIGTLALGIAAPAALFAAVNATLLRPLPYPHAEDIYAVRTSMTDGRFTIGMLASEEMSALRKVTDAVVGSTLIMRRDETVVTDAGSRQVTSYGVSEGFFDLFGVPMAMGRSFSPEDYTSSFMGGRIVLSNHAWRTIFGADPQIVGHTIRFGGASSLVVGVAPEAFAIPREADLWFAQHNPETIGHGFDAFIRLKPGLTLAAIQGPLPRMWADLAAKYPDFEKNRVFVMRPLLEAIVGDLGPLIWIAFAATGLLLVLAIVNVANLLLARGTTRAREIGVRSALGATRADLLRPLLAESLLIALAATAVALPLASAAVRAIVAIGGTALPRVEGMHIDLQVFAFSAGVMIVAGLLVGLLPAVTMGRVNLVDIVNEGGRGALQGRATRRVLGAMIVVEVTLAIALVAGAGRLLLSMRNIVAIDPGFTAAGRLAIDVYLPPRQYVRDPQRIAAWAQLAEERLRALGATAVGSATTLPFRHEWDSTSFVDITGRPTDPAQRPNGRIRIVSPGLFSVLHIKIVAGRSFTADDRQGGEPVVLVNRAWARKFIPDLDPLRERVNPQMFGTLVDGKYAARDAAIVGVVEDVPYSDLTKEAEPTVYVSEAQVQPSATLRRSFVITTADGRPERLIPEIRAELMKLDPQVPIDFQRMSDVVSSSLIWPKLGLLLMATFGVAALALAASGVFGVIAFVAAQRSGEMAVRLALGATPGHVFRIIVAHGGALAAQGLVLGVLLAWWMGQLMTRYVYHVTAANSLVLAGSAALVLVASFAATLPSARRAATTQPASVLKP